MESRRTEQDYRARVARAVAAIVADPMAVHRLEDLARLAHFSPFHFHRVYASVAGETVAATVRRVRLALATQLLEAGDQSITQVAMAVGYESPQAFTRAFGQFTGQSPRDFQRQMVRAVLDVDAMPQAGNDGSTAPTVRIVERQTQRLHALRHRGSFATIPHTHRRLRLHAGTRVLSEHWGASFSDPEDTSGFRYYAATPRPSPGRKTTRMSNCSTYPAAAMPCIAWPALMRASTQPCNLSMRDGCPAAATSPTTGPRWSTT